MIGKIVHIINKLKILLMNYFFYLN